MPALDPINPDLHRHPALGEDEWQLFKDHFSIFPWSSLPAEPSGFELGCGSGMWAALVAQRCAKLWAIESDEAQAAQAQQHLQVLGNVQVHSGTLDDSQLEHGSMDFGYALSAIQDATEPAVLLRECVQRLKPGAPFLFYVCYALDNRPAWYRALWQASEMGRRVISRSSPKTRSNLSTVLALGAYLPLARAALCMERLGMPVDGLPLATYRAARFETMKLGAEERFAAPSQARFSTEQLRILMAEAGLQRVQVSSAPPFWTALGYRADPETSALGA